MHFWKTVDQCLIYRGGMRSLTFVLSSYPHAKAIVDQINLTGMPKYWSTLVF